MADPKTVLRELFDAAVAVASPVNCMHAWLPEKPAGQLLVVGAGKAAASMAKELELAWTGPLQGSVIVPYGYGADCRSIEVIEASIRFRIKQALQPLRKFSRASPGSPRTTPLSA